MRLSISAVFQRKDSICVSVSLVVMNYLQKNNSIMIPDHQRKKKSLQRMQGHYLMFTHKTLV